LEENELDLETLLSDLTDEIASRAEAISRVRLRTCI
jgi:hypothetical protein